MLYSTVTFFKRFLICFPVTIGKAVWVRDDKRNAWEEEPFIVFAPTSKGVIVFADETDQEAFEKGNGGIEHLYFRYYTTTDPAKDKKEIEVKEAVENCKAVLKKYNKQWEDYFNPSDKK